jgi:hypothetical protein
MNLDFLEEIHAKSKIANKKVLAKNKVVIVSHGL